MASQDFSDRPSKKLVLFDVDGTLTLARQVFLMTPTALPIMSINLAHRECHLRCTSC